MTGYEATRVTQQVFQTAVASDFYPPQVKFEANQCGVGTGNQNVESGLACPGGKLHMMIMVCELLPVTPALGTDHIQAIRQPSHLVGTRRTHDYRPPRCLRQELLSHSKNDAVDSQFTSDITQPGNLVCEA